MVCSEAVTIIIARQSLSAYLEPGSPVHLHPNGDLTCGAHCVKGDRSRNFRRMYEYARGYLTRKGLPLDVSGFRRLELIDVIQLMEAHALPSITIDRLKEIACFENSLAMTRELAKDRIEAVAARRWYKTYRRLLEDDPEAAREMSHEHSARLRIVNNLISSR